MKIVTELLRFVNPSYRNPDLDVLTKHGVPEYSPHFGFFTTTNPIYMPPQREPVPHGTYKPINIQYQYNTSHCYYYAAMHIIFSAYSRECFNTEITEPTPDFGYYFNKFRETYYSVILNSFPDLYEEFEREEEGGYDFVALIAIAQNLKINTFYHDFDPTTTNVHTLESKFMESKFNIQTPFLGIFVLIPWQIETIFSNIAEIEIHEYNIIGFMMHTKLENEPHVVSFVRTDDFQFVEYDSSSLHLNKNTKKYNILDIPYKNYTRVTIIIGEKKKEIEQFKGYLFKNMIVDSDKDFDDFVQNLDPK